MIRISGFVGVSAHSAEYRSVRGSSHSWLLRHLTIHLNRPLQLRIEREVVPDVSRAGGAHLAELLRVGEEVDGGGDEGVVVDGGGPAVDVFDDQLAGPAGARAEHRHADAHRFGGDEGEAFAQGREQQGVGGLVDRERVAVAEELDPAFATRATRSRFRRADSCGPSPASSRRRFGNRSRLAAAMSRIQSTFFG